MGRHQGPDVSGERVRFRLQPRQDQVVRSRSQTGQEEWFPAGLGFPEQRRVKQVRVDHNFELVRSPEFRKLFSRLGVLDVGAGALCPRYETPLAGVVLGNPEEVQPFTGIRTHVSGHVQLLLLAQAKRLRLVRENVEQHERLVGNVVRGVSNFRDSLASRAQLCKSLVAAAENTQARQGNAAAATTSSMSSDDDPVGAAFDQLCCQRVATMAAHVDQLDHMRLRRQRVSELLDRLEADIIASCQGSMSK
ncbi:hypothetical protein MTO96_015098 [Rhipicephalus appendiculatus]